MNQNRTISVFMLLIISISAYAYVILNADGQTTVSKRKDKNPKKNQITPNVDVRTSKDWYRMNEAFKKNEWYFKNGMISSCDYHSDNAHIYLLIGELDLAHREIEAAIADSPICSDAYGMLSIYYASVGNIPQAFVANDRAINLDPDSGVPYQNRAVIYSVIEDRQNFLACYNIFIKLQRLQKKFVLREGLEMALLIDDPKSSYKFAMMDIKDLGLKDIYSQTPIIWSILSLRYLKREKEADSLLKEILKWSNPKQFQYYYFFKYLNRDIAAQELINHTNKQDLYKQKWYELQAHTIIGVDLDQKGDIEESQKHLNWVIMNRKSATTTSFVEGIAKPLIRKQNQKLMNQQKAPKL